MTSTVDTTHPATRRATRPLSSTPHRIWWIVAAALFASAWGGNEFTPLLVMYRQSEGFGQVTVNALLFAYVLGIIPALILGGPLSDRFGRRPVMLPAPWIAISGSVLLAIDGASVLLTHLSEVIRNNLPQFLSYKDMRGLLDRLEPEYKRLLDEIAPAQISYSGLQAVLKLLLSERVSIHCTGRSSSIAALIATAPSCGRLNFAPNAPPTWGVMTRISSSPRSKAPLIMPCTQCAPCELA